MIYLAPGAQPSGSDKYKSQAVDNFPQPYRAGIFKSTVEFIRKTLVIAELEIYKLRRDPSELIMRAVQPVLWLVVFGSVFTRIRAIPTGDLRYIDFLAPGVLAAEAKRLGVWLVHYSTDYVFDGSGDEPWLETDLTGPLSGYGASKLEGEQLIQQSGCKHLIFRTSWVYGARGGNFAKTMLRLAQERDNLSVIDDQIGAPTGADLLADITAHAIRAAWQQPELSGLYHLVATGETSWHGYASFVLAFARQAGVPLKVATIEAVPTSAFPTAATRPHNSRLSTGKLTSAFGLHLPHWQAGVTRMLTEILDEKS